MLDFFIAKKLFKNDRTRPTKVIIDTDMGADDVQALFVLKEMISQHPDIELLGITCCWGNTSLDNVVRNALVVRKLAGLRCGVFRGCSESLLGRVYDDGFFGVDGINGQQK